MSAPLHCYTGAGGGEFLESCGVVESKWCCGFMVEATNSLQSVLAPSYAVDGYMGAPLHCNTCVIGGEFLENWD